MNSVPIMPLHHRVSDMYIAAIHIQWITQTYRITYMYVDFI